MNPVRQNFLTIFSGPRSATRIIHSLTHDCGRLLLTFSIALGFGWLLLVLQFPAPFLLGSVFGVWLTGVVIPGSRRYLGVANWCHTPVIIGLGVLMGAMFTPETAAGVIRWWPTVIAMMGATLGATALGYYYLARVKGYNPTLALLCSMPGGQAEIAAISPSLVEKDYVVALCHLTRVTVVFCLAPFLLSVVEGHEAVLASNQALADFPKVMDLNLFALFTFAGIAVCGYLGGIVLRLPMPRLLGPLILSIGLHASGLISVSRISEFIVIAQLTIGGGIGARLAKVPFRTLAGYLRDALTSTTLVIMVYLVTAVFFSQVFEIPLLSLVLAFIPGGLYEVTLLALLFGFDVAFVTFHHVVRVLFIFFSLGSMIDLVNPENKGIGHDEET